MKTQPSPESPQPSATKGANHTPWFTAGSDTPETIRIVDRRGMLTAYAFGAGGPRKDLKANARLIVDAVNAYASPHSNQQKIAALRGNLKRVTEELAELIKGEADDKEVGITGWNALHESVAQARAVLEWIETGDSPNKEGEA